MDEFFTLSIPRLIAGQMGDDYLKEHLNRLAGLTITDYIPELYCEAIINFSYKGYRFSADNGYLLWTFYCEESCPSELREELINHCTTLLDS